MKDQISGENDNNDPKCDADAGMSAAEAYETMEEHAGGLDNAENDVNRLKEFLVLDEFNPDSDKDQNNDSESDEDSDDVPDEEVEAMLDEGLPEGYKGAPKKKECPYDQIQKIILEDKGINHFEVLPLGWLIINHNSGLPLYLHKSSRVCTLARPYFLGPGSARKHEIPVTAIPCFNYRRALQEEERLTKESAISKNLTNEGSNVNDSANVHLINKKTFKRPFEITMADNVKDALNDCATSEEITKKCKLEILSEGYSGYDLNNIDSTDSAQINKISNKLSIGTDIENKNKTSGIINNEKATIVIDLDVENEINSKITSKQFQNELSKECLEKSKNIDSAKENKMNGEFSATEKKPCYDTDVNKGNVERKGGEKDFMNVELLKKLVNTDNVEEERNALVAMMPSAKVETAQENWKSQHLRHEEVTEYCKKLFKFKYIKIMKFKSWSERRQFTKTRQALQRPTLPDGTKLITFPIQADIPNNSDGSQKPGAYTTFNKTAPKECLMNPNGKSYVCILHEYVQRALKKQPTYEYKEFENGSTPYSATISINGMKYGVGYGTSKRQAKSAAAKTTIEILIPEMRDKIKQDDELNGTASRTTDQDLEFFDDIKIEDPRVYDFCAKTMEPSPHTVLQTCLARNFGIGDREIKYQMNTLKHQRNEFTMTVGKHSITVLCKNKREGKQRASQGILQALHPNITSWGSLLRLYGNRSVKSFKEKKQEEQEITLLQSRAAVNQPNYAILEKLRTEMSKLAHKDKAIAPIGTLLVQEHLPEYSGSNLNNVDL